MQAARNIGQNTLEAPLNNGKLRSQTAVPSGTSMPGPSCSAGSDARSVVNKTAASRVQPVSEGSSMDKPDPTDEEVETEEAFPDESKFIITPYSKTRLKKMGKDQMLELILRLQTLLASCAQAYANVMERLRRDSHVCFARGKDSSLLKSKAEPKQDAKEESEQESTSQKDNDQESDSPEGGSDTESGTPKKKRTWKPKRSKGFSQNRDERIPVMDQHEEASPDELQEIFHGNPYKEIGTHVIEEYRTLPARVYLLRRIVHTYKDCVTGEIYETTTASACKLLPGSRVSTDLLGYLASEYYYGCTPINRQVKKLGREGCQLTKQCSYRWLRSFGRTSIIPVATYMLELALSYKKIQMDETYCTSLEELIKHGRKNCYIWLLRTSEALQNVHPVIAMVFTRSRSAEQLQEILGEYSGSIECDGYSVYPAVTKRNTSLVISCCLWHVYHQFVNVTRGLSGWNKMTAEERSLLPVSGILDSMREIFAEEKKITGLSREERENVRMNVILPKAEALYVVIEEHAKSATFDQGSLFGKALTYAVNRKPYIMAGIKDPDMPIHNLASERCFINTSLFRNGSKFFATNTGGEIAAAYFTVCQTCNENGHDIATYLQFLFENIPNAMKAHEKEVQAGDLSFLYTYMPWEPVYTECEEKSQERTRNMFRDIMQEI